MRPDLVDDVLVQVISSLICEFIFWLISILLDFLRWLFQYTISLIKKNIFYTWGTALMIKN